MSSDMTKIMTNIAIDMVTNSHRPVEYSRQASKRKYILGITSTCHLESIHRSHLASYSLSPILPRLLHHAYHLGQEAGPSCVQGACLLPQGWLGVSPGRPPSPRLPFILTPVSQPISDPRSKVPSYCTRPSCLWFYRGSRGVSIHLRCTN
jgi:hypothetical protein